MIKKFITCCFLVVFANSAYAQQQQIIGPADSGRIEKDLKKNKLPELGDKQFHAPGKKEDKELNAPANADEIEFVLKSLNIIGAKSLSKDVLKSVYAAKIGKKITLLDVYKFADEITKLYVAEGYILSRAIVPAQEISSGNVKIKVVEGKIGKVTISGYVPNKSFIQPIIDRIRNSKPLDVDHLEHNVLMMNDLAGVKFRTVLKPTGREGVVDLALIGEKVSFENEVLVNNYGSKFLGPVQGSVKLGVNHSYVLPFSQTEILLYGAKDIEELKFFDFMHSMPINSYGTKLQLKFSHSDARPGSTQKSFDIDGRTQTYEAEVSHPIIRSRIQNLRVFGGLTLRDNKTDLLNSPLVRDKIRLFKAGVNYDRTDSFRGINNLVVEYVQGISGLGSSKNGAANLSRAQGQVDFSKLEASFSRYQALPYDFNLLAMLVGQYTDDVLLSSEEFGYGGPAFGRAYDSSEILGDKGIAGLVELRYMGVPKFYHTTVSPFVFYDFGRVWNLDSGQTSFVNASSGGIGFRANHKSGVFGVFTIAKPMDKRQANPLFGGDGHRPRYGFQIGFRF